jgi:hypothetical protein
MVFIDRLKAHLYAGDFVIASRGDRREVCKILSVVSSQQVKVQWWLTRDNPFFTEEMILLPPLLDNSCYPNISLYGMNECFDMPSLVSVIHISSIMDLAFVFHVDTLEHYWVTCAGMVRVYYIQYRYNANLEWIGVPFLDHSPFAISGSQSYPSRIWYSILSVVERFHHLMSDKRQLQFLKRTDISFFPLE